MRLALVTNNRFPPAEGVARHVLEVGHRLAARGHEVTVLARGRERRPRERALGPLRLVERPDAPLPGPARQLLDHVVLRRWLAAGTEGADLVHAHLPLLPPIPRKAPLVATFHSPMLTDSAAITEPGWRPALLRLNARLVSCRLERWYIDHADRLVAVSRGVREELSRSYGVGRGRVEVVTNGVDADFFAAGVPAARRPGSVLYAGRLGYRKGLARLLDAFAIVAAARPWAELVLVGEGPLRAALERRAADLRLAGRVRFTGFLGRETLRAELKAAACVVSPADYESGPLTLLEAMAAGAPVVSTPTGLARELGPEPPILLAAGNASAIARAVAACLDDPDAALARAAKARALVAHEFAWDRVVDRLEAVYGVGGERTAAAA